MPKDSTSITSAQSDEGIIMNPNDPNPQQTEPSMRISPIAGGKYHPVHSKRQRRHRSDRGHYFGGLMHPISGGLLWFKRKIKSAQRAQNYAAKVLGRYKRAYWTDAD